MAALSTTTLHEWRIRSKKVGMASRNGLGGFDIFQHDPDLVDDGPGLDDECQHTERGCRYQELKYELTVQYFTPSREIPCSSSSFFLSLS